MAVPEATLAVLRDKSAATRIAVIGATNNPRKYGNIIARNLHRRGYMVLPVNPNEPDVAGLPAWPTVTDIGNPVHIANFVVPPAVVLQVLAGLDPQQVGVVWFQDGSFDARVVQAAEARFGRERVVAGDCIMVVAGWA